MKKTIILAMMLATLSTGAQAAVDNCANSKTYNNIEKKQETHFYDLYIKIDHSFAKAIVNDDKVYNFVKIGAGPNNTVKRTYKMTREGEDFFLDVITKDNGRAVSAVITGPRKTFHWDCR